jgi:hypothetical protein
VRFREFGIGRKRGSERVGWAKGMEEKWSIVDCGTLSAHLLEVLILYVEPFYNLILAMY